VRSTGGPHRGERVIGLATVDRWLSSSVDANRRRKSTLRNAQRGTIVIVILSIIIQTQQLDCFEANLTNTPLKCYTRTVLYGIISDLFFCSCHYFISSDIYVNVWFDDYCQCTQNTISFATNEYINKYSNS
jgi:hypothetical protein